MQNRTCSKDGVETAEACKKIKNIERNLFMNKKVRNSCLAAGAMAVLSIGIIGAMNIFTVEKAAKQIALDLNGFTSEVAEVNSAAALLGAGDEVTGYVVNVSSIGFNEANPIVMDVTFDTTGTTITEVAIVEQQETPGLGANIANEDFTGAFAGVTAPVYTADMAAEGSSFDQIAGATISSKAVANGINAACEVIATIEK